MLVSAIWQRESAISVHVSPPSWTHFLPYPTPSRLSQSASLSSLCYTRLCLLEGSFSFDGRMNLRVETVDRPGWGGQSEVYWVNHGKHCVSELKRRQEREGKERGLRDVWEQRMKGKYTRVVFQGPIGTFEWIHPVGSSVNPQGRRGLWAGDSHLGSWFQWNFQGEEQRDEKPMGWGKWHKFEVHGIYPGYRSVDLGNSIKTLTTKLMTLKKLGKFP